jgi:hypothetical protein
MTVVERLMFYESMRYGRLQVSVKSMCDAGMPET